MPRPQAEKCRRCAKLTAAEAQKLHGPEGDGCWTDEANRCNRRRSYYRHRDRFNQSRRLQRDVKPGLERVEILAVPAAVLHLYRARVDDPVHAVGAELWIGQERRARLEPVHCFGLTPGQLSAYAQQVLAVFSTKYGAQDGKPLRLEKFASHVELNPQNCPIRPCPLHP
ncbi:hypothetical protein [Leptolyngbya sp. FACHB-261]|uniref:hypothetical protein n=1 Tax=Leptolyngbya sp. FACHB-261 TaxID=2692806 RepID=UPI0016877F26|nr:hypothetical protein [Leptolyngbya sp. FACHB-261]MBD2105166.1 hypothetical protein [Leptolyngbya sp. FACHB-261]